MPAAKLVKMYTDLHDTSLLVAIIVKIALL